MKLKQTKCGLIPEHWECLQMSDVADINSQSLSSNTDANYEFNYIDIESVDNGVIKKITKVLFKSAPSRARRIVQTNDIIMSTVRPYLRAFALISEEYNKSVVSTGFAVISCKDNVLPQFVFKYLFSRNVDDYIEKCLVGSNYPAINSNDVKQLPIPIPSPDEQKRIVAILETWDKAIEQIKELINIKERRFQLELSKLIEYIEKHDSTKNIMLRDILSYEQPTKYIVESSNYVDNGKIPVLTANKSFILGYTDERNGIYRNIPVIIFDDFTTDSKYVEFSFKVKSSAIKILKPYNDDELLLVYWLISRIRTSLGGHRRYWISEYQFNEIPLPEKAIQMKTSRILKTRCTEISLLKNIEKHYKKQRKQLMEILLKGNNLTTAKKKNVRGTYENHKNQH